MECSKETCPIINRINLLEEDVKGNKKMMETMLNQIERSVNLQTTLSTDIVKLYDVQDTFRQDFKEHMVEEDNDRKELVEQIKEFNSKLDIVKSEQVEEEKKQVKIETRQNMALAIGGAVASIILTAMIAYFFTQGV